MQCFCCVIDIGVTRLGGIKLTLSLWSQVFMTLSTSKTCKTGVYIVMYDNWNKICMFEGRWSFQCVDTTYPLSVESYHYPNRSQPRAKLYRAQFWLSAWRRVNSDRTVSLMRAGEQRWKPSAEWLLNLHTILGKRHFGKNREKNFEGCADSRFRISTRLGHNGKPTAILDKKNSPKNVCQPPSGNLKERHRPDSQTRNRRLFKDQK